MYVIGEPGVGKSTLLRTLTAGMNYEDLARPFAMRRYTNGVIALGRDGVEYSGTDTLAFNVKDQVLGWLGHYAGPRLVMGEGARLANAPFFQAVIDLGYELHLYHLVGAGMAHERRSDREKPQKESYAKGRRTSARYLADAFGALDITTRMPPEFLARLLNDPVSMEFR